MRTARGALRRAGAGPIAVGLSALVALGITFGYNLWSGQRAELQVTEQTTDRLVRALEDHTIHTFSAVDGTLKATLRHLALLKRLDGEEETSVRSLLGASAAGLRQIQSIILFDEAGFPRNGGLLAVPPSLNVSERAFFKQHEAGPTLGVSISTPQPSMVAGDHLVITVSRRVADDEGRFAGVLAAEIPVDYLTSTFYRALNIGPRGMIMLARADGILLARESTQGVAPGTSVAEGVLFRDMLPQATSGTFRASARLDGIERIVSYRQLADLPLVVAVGIAVDDALAVWHQTVREFAAIWLLVVVVVLGMTVLSVRDARRHEAAERESRRAWTLLSDAVESLDGGIALYDANDRLVLTNRWLIEHAPPDYAARAVPGASYLDLAWSLARSGTIADAVGREADWVAEHMARHRQPDRAPEIRKVGSTWRQISERTTDSGGVIILASDVTPLKRTEEALRESEERLEGLARNIPGYVYQRRIAPDGQARFLYISEGARGFFGHGPEVLIESSEIVRNAVHPEDRERIAASIRIALSTLAPWNADYRLVSRDGTVRWVTSQARARRAEDGAVLWDGVVVDITARKQAEAAMHQAMLHAERTTREKSSFLAAMSHELRTPLNSILGFSEVLMNISANPRLAAKSTEYAADINTAGHHLLQLINDLLDLSKAEAGRMELAETTVDIAQTIQRALHLVTGRAEQGGVSLAFRVPVPLPQIRADERKLLQIALNLLSNAIRFTPAGGSIIVTAERDRSGAIALTFADTGIGIASEDVAQALQSYGQIDNAVTRATSGTGLGLPIARQLAQLHGGTLTLSSVKGVGTRVVVVLPADRVIQALAAPDASRLAC
jgi:PAS domain S-box-containing protein